MSVAEPDDKTPETPSSSETIASPEPTKAPESATAPSAAETVPTETPATPAKSNREQLIAQLTAEKTKQTSAADESKPETEEEAPAAETTEAPTETAPAEKVEAEVVPETDKNDSDEVFSEAELKGYKPRTAARIRSLLEERKQIAPVVQFGLNLLTDLDKAKIPPEQFAQWARLGIEIEQGTPGAAEKLVKMAEHLGYKAPAPAPVLDEDWLTEQIVNGEISAAAAKGLRAKLKAAAPVPKPVEPTKPAAPAQPAGLQRSEIDQATGQMEKIAGEYKTKYPADFAKLHDMAIEKLKTHKGVHPSAWPHLFKEILNGIVVEQTKKQATAAKPPLRPGTTSTPAQPQKFKSSREETIARLSK